MDVNKHLISANKGAKALSITFTQKRVTGPERVIGSCGTERKVVASYFVATEPAEHIWEFNSMWHG